MLEVTLVVIEIITVTFHKIILYKAILDSMPIPTGAHYILTQYNGQWKTVAHSIQQHYY